MKRDTLREAQKYTRAHRRRRRWYRLVTALACVVVFCTVYALILPAITLEQVTCGKTEHTHTVDCYTQVTSVSRRVPVCNAQTLQVHQHSDACRDGAGRLVCGYADFVVHKHDASCRGEDGTLWCTLPELEAHTHDAGCYAPVKQPHVHTDECYTCTQGELTCTEHVHTDGCYTDTTELSCGQEESDAHHHDESCYTPTRTLSCGISSDHQHTAACYQQTKTLSCGFPAEPEAPAAPELICGKQEIQLHTHRPYVSPEDPGCYDKSGSLTCGRLQVLEHQHTDACFETRDEPVDTGTLTCPLTQGESHTHGPRCYGTWELTCGMEEHTHSDACRGTAVSAEEEQAKVQELIALIDALPTPEEVEQRLTELEDAEDEDGYNAYYEEVRNQCVPVYIYYQAIDPQYQELVTNKEKLFKFDWLWSLTTYATTNTVNVTAVNAHSYSATIIYHSDSGMSVGDNTSGEKNYAYWTAVVVELEDGKYVVKTISSANGTSKSSLYASGNGFILLYHGNNVADAVIVSVGDVVTLSSDFWKTKHSYDGTVHGTVTFSTPAQHQLKPDKDNTSKLTIIPGADTRELIEVNLYDYGSNINEKYNNDSKYPGFQQEFGSRDVGTSLSKWASFNFGNNITEDLDAGKSNVTVAGGTTINATTDGANSPISGAMQSTLGSDGYPALSDGTSLSYLFSNNTYATKKNSQSINGLFQYNATTGAYTFNSRENHAQFNAGSDTFTLYRQMLTPNFMMYPFGNFLPFNDIVHVSAQTSTIDRAYLQTIADSALYKAQKGARSEYNVLGTQLNTFVGLMDTATGVTTWKAADAMNKYFALSGIPKTFSQNETFLQNLYSLDYDEPTDFYFGMEMKMKFIQPKDGLTGKDTNGDGVSDYPMVFDFSGDDDVWVYVDGKLFLDLSGIHRHVGGKIDFTKGEVYYYSLDVSTGDVSTTPYQTVKFSDLVDSSVLNSKGTFKDYSTHTFNFYYMERGSGSGVCRMNFNFPVLRKNTITVSKQVSIDGETLTLLGNPDFRFQIFKGDDSGDLLIGGGEAYDIFNSADEKIATRTTDSNGVFTLKANQTAVFGNIPENAGTYYVRELLDPDAFEQYGKIYVNGSTVTENNNVTVGEDTFTGVNSPVKDTSDGSTSFTFNNNVDDITKLGKLSVTKELTAADGVQASGSFDFSVTLDGAPLPVGTAYTVETETRTVTTEGIISLAPGETATISNILAGSRFTVAETSDSSDGYAVTYYVDGTEVSSASGITKTASTVAVRCNNSEPFASVNIPVQKNLQFPDGKEHNYTILLEQVTDQSGNAAATPAFTRELPVQITSDPVNAAFQIEYPQSSLSTLPQTFYYQITEQVNAEETGTVFDTSSYVVEVTVGTSLTASITGVWKDGSQIDSEATLSFNNTIAHYELPNTGGAGTAPYLTGGLLVLLSGVLLTMYRGVRRRKEDNGAS